MTVGLVASFVTLSGAGFNEPARNPLMERCRAAKAAGFTGIGLHVDDVDRLAADGTDLVEVRDIVNAADLELVEIEFLAGWAVGAGGPALTIEDRAYALADAVGGRHLSAGEFSPAESPLDVEATAKRLSAICERAADHDLRLALEAFPWSPIKDIRTAREVLEQADAPNSGLLIDVWHFFNCGATFADLDRIWPGRIAAVQLNDGPRVATDLLWNARNTRWLPGDGELDVVGLIRCLDQIGFTGPYCVEVNYPRFRGLPVDEAAAQAYAKAVTVLRTARSGTDQADPRP
jgi:sugar phosphate isomerase/epimerase